jgi:hypothetical protein
MAGGGKARPLEFTPTWIVASVCSIIVIISFIFERLLHRLGKVRASVLAPAAMGHLTMELTVNSHSNRG